MKCEALVRGSIYSRKGGNRYDDCEHEAKYRVERSDDVVHVCGVHVRRYVLWNARWSTGYVIDTLKAAATK